MYFQSLFCSALIFLPQRMPTLGTISRSTIRRSLAAVSVVAVLLSIAQPVGLPVFQRLSAVEDVSAQMPAGQWVPAWHQSCQTACASQGMEAALSPAGDQCASGENVVQSAHSALGSGIFQSACWPNKDCSQNLIGDGDRQTRSVGSYCYATRQDPPQKQDGDATDITAACYCQIVFQPLPECSDGRDNDGDGATDGADYGCQSGSMELDLAQCQDGRDNDQDGMADAAGARVPGIAPLGGDTFSIGQGNPFAVREFVNSRASLFGLPTVPMTNALAKDSATANQICRMAGYKTVQSVACESPEYGGRCSYTSTIDNGMSRWNGSSFVSSIPATGSWISSLVCTDPIRILPCQDGKDNDGDGAVDFPNDNGCESPEDTSEMPSDPSCTQPQDNDESPVDRPDLRITKIPQSLSVVRGQSIGYVVGVQNAGTAPATNVRITDRVPSGVTFDTASSPSCALNAGDVECLVGTLQPGQATQVLINFTTPAASGTCTSSSIINTASVASEQTDLQRNDNTVTAPAVTLQCPPRQCADGMDNDGDTFIDFPQDLSCTSPEDDQESPDDRVFFTVTKTGPASVVEGTSVTYSVTIRNTGATNQSNVQLVDRPGPGLAFVSSSPTGCSVQGAEVVCPPVAVNEQATKTYSLTFTAERMPTCAPGATLWNEARVVIGSTVVATTAAPVVSALQCAPQCSDGRDNDGDGAVDYPADFSCSSPDDNDEKYPVAQCQDDQDNDGDTYVDFPQDPSCASFQDNTEAPNDLPQFTVQKAVDGSVPAEGGIITYAVTLKNIGTASAQHVQLVDLPGQGLSFVSSSPTGCSVQPNGVVTCAPVTVAAQQANTYKLSFRVEKLQTCPAGGFTVQNAAKVTVAGVEVAATQAPTSSTIQCLPQCSDGRDNDGDGAVDDPADFSCSSPSDDDEANPKAQCQDGIDNDGDGFIDAGSDRGCDSSQDNDEHNDVLTDLYVTKVGPAEADRGSIVTYQLTATNLGPDTAQHVAIADDVPSGLTFVPASSSSNCVPLGGRIVCDNLTLGLLQSATVNVAFRVGNDVACNANITNLASVSAATYDPTSDNNRDESTMRVHCPVGTVTLTKSDGRETAAPGETLTYTIIVSNTSAAPTAPTTLTDQLPSGVSFFTASDGGIHSGGFVTWTLPAVAPGTTVQRTVTVKVASTVPSGTVLTNRVIADASSAQDSTTVVVTNLPQCSDFLDNDGDGLIDANDPGCSSAIDDDESNPPPVSLESVVVNGCNVTIRYAKTITACAHLLTTSLTPLHSQNFFCADQGVVTRPRSDFLSPFAPGLPVKLCDGNNYGTCSATVTVTGGGTCTPTPQCRDGIDNDGDGATDFPADFSCSSAEDNDETLPKAQCQDGIDNDGDGLKDYPMDPGCSSLQDNDETHVVQADLSILKTAVSSIQRGGTLLYTLTASNAGPHRADDVVMQDILPNGLIFDPGHSSPECALIGGSVVCAAPDLMPGASHTAMIAAMVPATLACGLELQNTATVATSSVDPFSANNTSAVVRTTVSCPAATFALTKSDSRETVAPHETLTYVLRLTNTSQTPASSITLTDVLPSLTNFVSASDGGLMASGVVTWTIAALAPGASVERTVSVTVAANAPQGAVLTNRGMVGAVVAFDATTVVIPALPQCKDGIDNDGDGLIDFPSDLGCTDPLDDQEFGEPDPMVDLKIDGQDGAVTRTQGQSVTLSWTSVGAARCTTGDSAMPGWGSQETLPLSGTRQVSAVQSGIYRIQCSKTMTSSFTAQDSVALSVILPPPTDADIAITSLSGPSSALRGSQVTYVANLQNVGPATATNVVLSHPVPAGTEFVQATDAACQVLAGTVQCPLGSMTTGAPRTLSFTFAILPATPCVTGSVAAHVSVTSDHDPVLANNVGFTSTQITCPVPQTADLLVQKSGDAIVTRGEQAMYVLRVRNLGPASSTARVLTDTAPEGFVFSPANSQIPAGVTCTSSDARTVSCSVPALAAEEEHQIRLAFITPVLPACTANASVTNVAELAPSSMDPVTANDRAEASTLLLCPATQRADLALTKTVPSGIAGQPLTFTLIGFNAGPSAAQNVVIQDPLPAGSTFVSASGASCELQASSVLRCSLGTLASGQSTPIIAVTVTPALPTACVPTTLVNTASVSSSTEDPSSANNSATATATIACPTQTADLSVTKAASATSVLQGQQIVYTLTGTNNGPATVTNAHIVDTLPQGLSYVSASFVPAITGATCTVSGQTVTCTVPSLAAGASASVSLTAKAKDPATTCAQESVTNTVTINQANPAIADPNTANNTASLSTTLLCPSATTADLSVTKSASATSVSRGSTVSYALVVTNNGPAAVSNVKVADALLSGSSHLTYQSASFSSGSSGTCQTVGNTVECTFAGSFAVGQTATVTLTFLAPTITGTCDAQTVTDKATVSESDTAITDPVSTNNDSATISTTVTCSGTATIDHLSMTKTHSPSTPTVGQYVRYAIELKNSHATASMTGLSVSDALPSGLTFLWASDGGTVNGSTVTWSNLTLSPNNVSRTIYIDATVTAQQTYTNTAKATLNGQEKSASDTFTPQSSPTYQPPVYPPTYQPPTPYYPTYPTQPTTPYYPTVQYPVQPTVPTVTYPTSVQPTYIMPATGAEDALFGTVTEEGLQPVSEANAPLASFPSIFYATLMAILAAGSAAGAKLLGLGM